MPRGISKNPTESRRKRSESLKLAYREGRMTGMKGKHHSEEWKQKHSESMKGNSYGAGYKHTDDAKRKIGLSHTGVQFSEERKQKISLALKGNSNGNGNSSAKGKKFSDETKRKMSEAQKRIGNIPPSARGRKRTEETKEKMREATVAYVERTAGVFYPRIGRNEKVILDNLEKEIGYTIDRNFRILGYFPDGYIHELNLIIEVDEIPKVRARDMERENNIKNELGCEFLRIRDNALV